MADKLKFKTAKKGGEAEYELIWRKPHKKYNADGLCWPPIWKDPKIMIDPCLSPRREISVLAEELAHAFFWDKTEAEVRKFSSVLSQCLYKRGWRKRDTST